MTRLPKCFRSTVLLAAVAAGLALAAPSADAGLRDTFKNARDTAKCASTAVFRPLKIFARGFKNFGDPEGMSEREYAREADKSTKEAMKECLAASENIMARSFGVEKVTEKAREVAAKVQKAAESARSAADEVSKWFDGKKKPREDGRMALSVGDGEREFYERATGVLGDEPLPVAKPSPLDEDIKRLLEEKRQLDEQEAAWEAGTRDDAPPPETPAGARPGQDVWREQPEPGCREGEWGCGEEYWNKELQAKASRLDPWAALREGEERKREGAGPGQGEGMERAAKCADPWGDCSGTQDAGGRWGGARERVGQGSRESARPDDADSRADYTSALASLLGERASGSETDYRTALEKMEEKARRQKQREEAKRARMQAEARRRKQRDEERARAKASAPSATASARSGSGTDTAKRKLSSNCEADVVPTCRRAAASAETTNASLQRTAQSGRMSRRQKLAVLVQMTQNGLNAARTCLRVEPRPHCKAMYRRAEKELERTRQSALRQMR